MEELMYLELINDLENAEEGGGDDYDEPVDDIARNAFIELSEKNFIKFFRLSKKLCKYLVTKLEPLMKPQNRPSDLDIPLKVLTALRVFASGSYQVDIACNKYLSLSQPSVLRCVREVVEALNRPEVFQHFVAFPQNIEEQNVVRRRFYEKHHFPGIVGCIDCTHVAIFPPNIEAEDYPKHIYVNRKGYHSINVQLVCDVNLKILHVNAKYPGSSNDTFIWNNSNLQQMLRHMHNNGASDYFLLGDSGYLLRSWLLTPLENEPMPNLPEHHYNVAHKRIRSTIERCNGVLKTRFRCLLKHRVLHYSPEVASKIINACVALHNLWIEHNILEPEAEEDLDENDFGIIDQIYENPDAIGRINSELAAGRQVRRKLIQHLFGNNN